MIAHKTLSSTCAVTLVLGTTVIGGGTALAADVFPTDVIVQGSLCVGFDCTSTESFGFDTIRLKENNTRIKFDDTSTSAGFPANDWQLTANDSASGGASKFSIEDITGAKVPFTITAGAATNSLFVDSTGRIGFRTSTPVLDLHVATSNTPGLRLEQNNSGGFTAQTWDVAGNEANFFVRDVTGGSKLPFRIRPGAPTSSIDIAASGNVGIGTASPQAKLDVFQSGAFNVTTPGTTRYGLHLTPQNATVDTAAGITFGAGDFATGQTAQAGIYSQFSGAYGTKLYFATTNSYVTGAKTRMMIDSMGLIGIGTATPARQLHTTGDIRFAGLTGCASGIVSAANGDLSCLGSSRQIKNLAGELPAQTALANIMALRPQTGSYKLTPDIPEHWLIAEEVADVDPALVGLNDGKPHVVKTQNIVADLVAVVQQQQRQIEELRQLLSAKQ